MLPSWSTLLVIEFSRQSAERESAPGKVSRAVRHSSQVNLRFGAAHGLDLDREVGEGEGFRDLLLDDRAYFVVRSPLGPDRMDAERVDSWRLRHRPMSR